MNRSLSSTIACGALVIALNGCNLEPPTDKQCPALLPKWSKPTNGRSGHLITNVVAFTDNGITWNRQPISNNQLQTYLARGLQLNPVPFIVLDPTNARSCAEASKVRDVINRAGDCQGEGMCGQGSAADWEKALGSSVE